MRLPKYVRLMLAFTVLSLIYIHMQMQIFTLAYQAKTREKEIIELSENNGVVAYDILKLKSANNLGGQLLNEESKLHFHDKTNVVQIVSAQSEIKPAQTVSTSITKKTNALLSLFSLKPAPEARAEELRSSEQIDEVKPWRRSR